MRSLTSACKPLLRLLVPVIAASVTSIALAGSVTYTYDTLGRLSKATYSNGVVVTYAYDAAGNRTVVTVTGAPS